MTFHINKHFSDFEDAVWEEVKRVPDEAIRYSMLSFKFEVDRTVYDSVYVNIYRELKL